MFRPVMPTVGFVVSGAIGRNLFDSVIADRGEAEFLVAHLTVACLPGIEPRACRLRSSIRYALIHVNRHGVHAGCFFGQ